MHGGGRVSDVGSMELPPCSLLDQGLTLSSRLVIPSLKPVSTARHVSQQVNHQVGKDPRRGCVSLEAKR
jgi:hypothetical protein